MISGTILAATAVWHTLAFWHFTFHPARTLARTTRERPVNLFATELFRFLGGLNLGLAVIAATAILVPADARWPVLLGLAVANASQFAVDVRVQRLGLAHGPMFAQILVGDAMFTVANAVALAL